MNIFAITERLRKELDTATTQASLARESSMRPGLMTEVYVAYGKKAEYQRGRADGIRLAISTFSHMLQEEINGKKSENKRKTNTMHLS